MAEGVLLIAGMAVSRGCLPTGAPKMVSPLLLRQLHALHL